MAKDKDASFQIIRLADGTVVKVNGPKYARFEDNGDVAVYTSDECKGKPVRSFSPGEVLSVTAPVTSKVAEEI